MDKKDPSCKRWYQSLMFRMLVEMCLLCAVYIVVIPAWMRETQYSLLVGNLAMTVVFFILYLASFILLLLAIGRKYEKKSIIERAEQRKERTKHEDAHEDDRE